MPKLVPIITDWSEADRLALVQKWHPAPVYRVERAANLDPDDQEAWYMVISEMTVANAQHDTTKGNHHPFKLTVKDCQKELGHRTGDPRTGNPVMYDRNHMGDPFYP